MNLRSKPTAWPPVIGCHCWVTNRTKARGLPAGLECSTEMIFLGRDPDNHTLGVLQRADGAIFRLPHNQYDHPLLWEVAGEWLPETDPRVHQVLRDAIERLRLDPCQQAMETSREETMENLARIILRNGGVL